MINVELIAEYSRFFNDKNSIQTLIKGVPKKLILQAATSFLNSDIQHKPWHEVLSDWFRKSNQQFLDFIVQQVNQIYLVDGKVPTIINTTSSLKLLQIGLQLRDDNNENQKSEEQIEVDLFKIYLLINESWASNQIINEEYIQKYYPSSMFIVIMISVGFSSSDVVNYMYAREFYSQAVKSFILFDFLKENKYLQPHVSEFLKKNHLTELNEYHNHTIPYINKIATKKIDGFIEFNANKDENYNENKFQLERLAVQGYALNEDIDFKIVRSSPLIKIDDDTYRVSHPLFFTDKLYKGLYFEFSAINEAIGGKIKNFRSFYTTNFSEKHLLYSVMAYILNNNYLKFTGADLEAKGIDGAPDFYIRNGKYVFLIENKDVLINGKIKEDSNFPELEKELKKKFLGDNRAVVGIRQLISNIKKVLTKENTFDLDYKESNVVIYPVLLVHDIMYDCPGLNRLFLIWFDEEIEILKQEGIDVKNVRPLVLLNIDTLICSAGLLKSRKINLKELLEIYIQRISKGKTTFKDEKEKIKEITTLYLPATKIIDTYLSNKFPGYLRYNHMIDYFFDKR